MSRIIFHADGKLLFRLQSTEGSVIELNDVPKVLETSLDREFIVQGVKFSLEIGNCEVRRHWKDYLFVVVPQDKDFHIYCINGSNFGGKFTKDILFDKALRMYPELRNRKLESLENLTAISENDSQSGNFCNNVFVLKWSSHDLYANTCEETELTGQELNQEVLLEENNEREKFSPPDKECDDNVDLKPLRVNSIVPDVKSHMREASQHFCEEEENHLNEVEEPSMDNAIPISVHMESSAIQQKMVASDLASKRTFSLHDDYALIQHDTEHKISKASLRKVKRSSIQCRKRSASEGDTASQELTSVESSSLSFHQLSRSNKSLFHGTSCINAKEWQQEKSEIVTSSCLPSERGVNATGNDGDQCRFEQTAIENGSKHSVKSAPISILDRCVEGVPLRHIRSQSDLSTKHNLTSSDFSSFKKLKGNNCSKDDVKISPDTPTLVPSVPVEKNLNASSSTNGTISGTELVAPQFQASSVRRRSSDDVTCTGNEEITREGELKSMENISMETCTSNNPTVHVSADLVPKASEIPVKISGLEASKGLLAKPEHLLKSKDNQENRSIITANASGEVNNSSSKSRDEIGDLSQQGDKKANTSQMEGETKSKHLVIRINQCDGLCGSKDTCIENSQAQLSQELVQQLLSCISSGDCSSEQLSITIVNNYGRFQGAMPPAIHSDCSIEEYTPNTSFLQPPIDCWGSQRQNGSFVPGDSISAARPVLFQPHSKPKEKPSSCPTNHEQSLQPVGCIGHIEETLRPDQQSSFLHVPYYGNGQYGENVVLCNGQTQGAAVVEVKVEEHDQQNAVQSCQPSYHPIVYPGPPRRIPQGNDNDQISVLDENNDHGAVCVGHGFKVNDRHADTNSGKIIFARSDMIPLIEGDWCPLPNMEHKKLGEGGNGVVVEHTICDHVYAVKKTSHQHGGLDIWKKLNHPNILSLLAVMTGPRDGSCYQFMPRMTGSLRDMICQHESLLMLSEVDPAISLESIANNAHFSFKSVLKALDYLAIRNMEHRDVKDSNILILKTCACPEIWSCVCPKEIKYGVMLADFDFITESKEAIDPSALPNVRCQVKSDKEMKHEPGTMGFRAPEQLMTPVERLEFFRKTVVTGSNEEVQISSCGPWCDVWSLGRTILDLCQGKHDKAKGRYQDANVLLKQPAAKEKCSSRNEDLAAIVALKDLQSAANTKCLTFRLLVELADKCLKPEFRERKTASQLFDWMEEKKLA